MSHLHTCAFCHVDACDVYSNHLLTRKKRFGFDLYRCQNCGINYLIEDGKPVVTKKTVKKLCSELYEKYISEIEKEESE